MVCASLCNGEKKKKSYDSVGKHVEEFATKIIFALTEYHSEYSCHWKNTRWLLFQGKLSQGQIKKKLLSSRKK